MIHDNEMISNGDEGIWVGSQSNEIVDNAVTGNQDYGVLLSGSADTNALTANTITDNANDGIGVATSDNEILDNTVADNGDDGLSLWEGADRNTLASNRVTGNDDDGIWIGSRSNDVVDNTVAGNGDEGVSLGASGEANLLVSNAILTNADDGLFVSSQGNEIDNNTLVDNGDDGLVLWDGADDNTVSWNRIAGNEDGIIVSASSGTVMSRNEITRNENYGLWAQDLSEPFDARENAWGAASGPSGGVADCQTGQRADGDGARIGTSSAEVCFDPWLSPQFLLSITDTNDPLLGGQDLEVTIRAENTWSVPSTQTVRLEDFDGRTVDTREDLSLAPGEATSLRLTWSTDGWDYGRDEVTVVSESHLDRQRVTILPNPLAS